MRAAILTALLVASVTALAGDDRWPNTLTERYDDFDNAVTLDLKPGFVYKGKGMFAGSAFHLGAWWNQAHPETVILVAELFGEIENIYQLRIRMDDSDVITLEPQNVTTEFESEYNDLLGMVSESGQSYVTSLTLVRKMLASDEVQMRLHVSHSKYHAATFSIDKTSAAIRGFRNLVKRIDELGSEQ